MNNDTQNPARVTIRFTHLLTGPQVEELAELLAELPYPPAEILLSNGHIIFTPTLIEAGDATDEDEAYTNVTDIEDVLYEVGALRD